MAGNLDVIEHKRLFHEFIERYDCIRNTNLISSEEMSGRGCVRSRKCPSGKCLSGMCPSGMCPSGIYPSGMCPGILIL